jgi:competence protein ComEA
VDSSSSVPVTGASDAVAQPGLRESFLHLQSFGLGFLVCLLLVGLFAWITQRPAPPAIVLQPPPTPLPTATPVPTSTPAPIVVFVSGAIASPGLYSLPAEARVGDALLAAGGLRQNAAAILINQAERLWDGAQVHVPDHSEEVSTARGPAAGVSGSAPAPQQAISSRSVGGLININSASADQLVSLPGIGPAKATAIIENRPYSSVDELERVPGIGAKTVEQLRNMVTVE